MLRERLSSVLDLESSGLRLVPDHGHHPDKIQQLNNLILFKFTDNLSDRLQELLDRKKSDLLTQSETLELEAIGELDDIFSYINATFPLMMTAKPSHQIIDRPKI